MKYRAEIDGLRALAVVPVILFHAGFELFSGGFVGVDVFFVISGYLITTILIEEVGGNNFSVVNFYERRARRILPALFFVIIACIPFAWMWMLPSQLKDFSHSLVAVSLFASNILFWQESGYFAAAAEEKPLLHTWSLAVEEQYYLLFPIFLVLSWRFGKNRVFWLIVVMAATSLLMSEWGWRNQATANFYLAPTRAWELFAGSIAAFILQKKGVQKNNPLALLGLAAIVFSIFAYDENTPFPSVYALVPVMGTVLLVLYADKKTLAARLLSTRGAVGIGLISYSSYLWHQPLFAFARLRFQSHPNELVMAGLSVLSLLLAFLSWKFVEKPFRVRGLIKRSAVIVFSIMGIVAFLLLGVTGHIKGGFPSRVAIKELPYHTFSDAEGDCMGRISSYCNINDNRRKIFVIGDSTIQPLAASLDALQDKYAVVPVTAAGCVLIEGYSLYDSGIPGYQQTCLSTKFDAAIDLIRKNDALLVIYGGMFSKAVTGYWTRENGVREAWRKQFKPDSSEIPLTDAIVETVKKISQVSESVVLVEFPETGINAQELLLKSSLFNAKIHDVELTRKRLFDWHREGREILSILSEIDNVNVQQVTDVLCNDGLCSVFKDGKQMFSDLIHPSAFYSDIVAQKILDELNRPENLGGS